MLSNIFREILLVSLLGSVVTGAILAVKAVFRHRLSPRLHYYIWVLLLLRLAIPFTVDTPASLVRLPPQAQATAMQSGTYAPPILPVPASAPRAYGGTGAVSPATGNTTSSLTLPGLWANVLHYGGWVWLAGALGLLAHMAAVNLLFWRRLQRSGLRGSRQAARVFARCKEHMGIRRDISLLLCPLAPAPMVFGLFRPKVLLSADLADTLTPQQLGYVLLHELTHWKRRDLLLHTLGNLLRAVHWFNPLLWYAIDRMKQDCEVACDDAVLRSATAQDRRQYGGTLLDMMALQSTARRIPGTVGFISNYHRRRMQMIAGNKKTSRLCTAVAALAVLAVLAGCAGSYPAAAGQQPTPTLAGANQPTATAAPTPTAEPNPTGTADGSEAPADADTPTPSPAPTPTGTADSSVVEADPTATPAPTPSATGGNRYDVSGIEDPQAFEAWFGQLQNLVRAGDKNAVAAQVLYPIRAKLNQKTTEIKDKTAFVKNYDAIFTNKVKQALLDQKVEETFVNYKGIMVGNGELWFTAVADTNPQVFVIYGINN